MSVAPISFLTPLGSRSGALQESKAASPFTFGAIGASGSRRTRPYGFYLDCHEDFWPDLNHTALPARMGDFLRLGGGPHNLSDFFDGGLKIYATTTLATECIAGAAAPSSPISGWTMAASVNLLSNYPLRDEALFGAIIPQFLRLFMGNWITNFAFRFSETDPLDLRPWLTLRLWHTLTGSPAESAYLAVVTPGDWNFVCVRVNPSGAVTVRLNSDPDIAMTTTVDYAASASLGFNSGLPENSRGVVPADGYTVGLNKWGIWPRYLSDAEVADLATLPAWPNVPAFPR